MIRKLKIFEIVIIILFFQYIYVEEVGAIKCYECFVTKKMKDNTVIDQLCSEFDESEKYEIDCPYSTMCEKKIFRLHLINKVQLSFERGCAKQKNTSMVLKDRKWVDEVNVEEPYQEGCFNNSEDDTEHCYCRGNYCNYASRLELFLSFKFLVAVILSIWMFFII